MCLGGGSHQVCLCILILIAFTKGKRAPLILRRPEEKDTSPADGTLGTIRPARRNLIMGDGSQSLRNSPALGSMGRSSNAEMEPHRDGRDRVERCHGQGRQTDRQFDLSKNRTFGGPILAIIGAGFFIISLIDFLRTVDAVVTAGRTDSPLANAPVPVTHQEA
jgi:hypothetical protein